mgnify:CR=1 FL=1
MFFLNEETTVAETLEVVQEVQQDLEQLKPNVVLETIKSWIPGLTKLGYRLLVAALIVCIENVAEDAGAESDPHGYGSFHTQVFTVCGVRDHLWPDNFYCS